MAFQIIEENEFKMCPPRRDSNGCLIFADFPDFKPNLTPKEILQVTY